MRTLLLIVRAAHIAAILVSMAAFLIVALIVGAIAAVLVDY